MATPAPNKLTKSPFREGSPDDSAVPQIPIPPSPADGVQQYPSARRSSFSFLRRKSSAEPAAGQRRSSGKMSRKQKEEAARRQREAAAREAAMLPKQPPRLPDHSPLPRLAHFGGDERPDSVSIVSNKVGHYNQNFSRPSGEYKMSPRGTVHPPMPPMPSTVPAQQDYDPYARTESMTHRGRHSYASSAFSTFNSPRRVRRRKDPTPFNILVVGTKGSGKSTFIEFLRTALALPAQKRPHTPSPPATAVRPDSPFTSQYIETEVDHERVGITLWDSEGLEKHIVDFQMPLITSFLESKFEDTFTEEQKVVRAPGVKDTHIHCAFLVLDPARLDANIAESKRISSAGGLSYGDLGEDVDIAVLRELQGRTTVIPVISKADTITSAHMLYLKKMVWESLKAAKLDPLEALHLDDDFDERDEDAYVRSDTDGDSEVLNKLLDRSSSSEAGSDADSPRSSSRSPLPSSRKHTRKTSAMSASLGREESDVPALPMSIISPDPYEPGVLGRKFPWGFADPFNAEHCDFARLRETVFGDWRAELREVSRDHWYEGWRTQRLQQLPDRRGITTSDGLAKHQLTVPMTNGRASSAGHDYRQHYGTPY